MKLSIITVNLNNRDGLRKTIDSVRGQCCMNFEHIIVDGASKDDSPSIIREYADSSTHPVHWVSEQDKGIYNAMNKGIDMARGEYLLFLNSGDALAGTQVVKHFINADTCADIASGIERMPNGMLSYPKNETELTYDFFYNDTLRHQSTFIKRDAFEKYGKYREDYRIVGDWEWFFRVIIIDNVSYQTLNFEVAIFDCNGISNSKVLMESHEFERARVHQEILPRLESEYKELQILRSIKEEYDHLKSGRFGIFVKVFLRIKQLKKKIIHQYFGVFYFVCFFF